MASNARSIVTGAAIGACLGAVVAWFLSKGGEGEERSTSLAQFDKAKALGVLWAVIGVIRLLTDTGED